MLRAFPVLKKINSLELPDFKRLKLRKADFFSWDIKYIVVPNWENDRILVG